MAAGVPCVVEQRRIGQVSCSSLLCVTAVHLANCLHVLHKWFVRCMPSQAKPRTNRQHKRSLVVRVLQTSSLLQNQTNTSTKMAFSTLNASRLTRPAPRAVAAAAVVPRTPARPRQSVALPPGRDSLRVIRRSSDTGAASQHMPSSPTEAVHASRPPAQKPVDAVAALALLLLPQVLKMTTSLCQTAARSCRASRWAGGDARGEGNRLGRRCLVAPVANGTTPCLCQSLGQRRGCLAPPNPNHTMRMHVLL